MKNTLFYPLVYAVFLFFFIGCSVDKKQAEDIDQNCMAIVTAPVLKAVVPLTGQIGQQIPIVITYWITNGCGGFLKFEETNVGNQKTIKVIAKYGGCVCTQPVFEFDAIYNFVPISSGIYTISVDKGDGTFFIQEININ